MGFNSGFKGLSKFGAVSQIGHGVFLHNVLKLFLPIIAHSTLYDRGVHSAIAHVNGETGTSCLLKNNIRADRGLHLKEICIEGRQVTI